MPLCSALIGSRQLGWWLCNATMPLCSMLTGSRQLGWWLCSATMPLCSMLMGSRQLGWWLCNVWEACRVRVLQCQHLHPMRLYEFAHLVTKEQVGLHAGGNDSLPAMGDWARLKRLLPSSTT